MKKENLVPKINANLRIEIINEALLLKIKKVIIFWDKTETLHYGYNLQESEFEKEVIERVKTNDVYLETINIEDEVKRYAFIGESKINYDAAWFPVEFPDEEKIKEQMEVYRT